MTTYNPNGAIIWQGPSQIDGSPIVVIVTGLKSGSGNAKTGGMLQTWILRADMGPVEAVKTGQDSAICGGCKHRGRLVNGVMIERTCYVTIWQAPRSVFDTFQRGRYEYQVPLGLGVGRKVRVGSYGDPAAVPAHVWQDLLFGAENNTGYSHQWANSDIAANLAGYSMASVDSLAEREAAKRLGWRTFRVGSVGELPAEGEILCPASEEAGRRTTCEKCGLCKGMAAKAKDIFIPAHGAARGHV